MILTGKALEDFNKWYDESVFFVDLEYDLVQYALIIEWLDSVGIYVNVLKYSRTSTSDAYVDGDYIYLLFTQRSNRTSNNNSKRNI